jgi:hypothetical protein
MEPFYNVLQKGMDSYMVLSANERGCIIGVVKRTSFWRIFHLIILDSSNLTIYFFVERNENKQYSVFNIIVKIYQICSAKGQI